MWTIYKSSHRELNEVKCKPMAVSFQCMTKFTTNKKKKLKKINFKIQKKKKVSIRFYPYSHGALQDELSMPRI